MIPFLKPLNDTTRWMLWAPVAIAIGVMVYFAPKNEPPFSVFYWTSGAAVLLLFISISLRQILPLYIIGLALIWGLLGFAAGMLRTAMVEHVVLQQKIDRVMAHGTVKQVDDRGSAGLRLILTDVDLWKIPREETPTTIRITVRGEVPEIAPGDRIAVRVSLSPPPRPVFPHGYDFARMIYFDRVGAVGFGYSNLRILEKKESSAQALERHRHHITERIIHALEPEFTPSIVGISAAMITGEAGLITAADLASLRASGLGHILSISGLHLVLASSILFVGARMFLALFPFIVLHYPIKKWAAVAAIIASFYYLLIAGMPVSAERAYFMICLFFLAIILDRVNTPMRPIALAAVFLLLIKPESVLDPSFQMSFAAVIALCAYFQEPQYAPTLRFHPIYKIWQHFSAIAMSSVVAGAATAPFAFYHFGQYAVYGLLANMLVIPLSSFVIMPAGILALLAMPIGLEHWPLVIMAEGVKGMMWVSDATTALPFSVLKLPHMSLVAMLLMVFGGLWICLWVKQIRWLGVIPILVGIMFYATQKLPDVVIEERGKLFAVKDAQYGMVVPARTYARYARTYWTKAFGLEGMVRFSELPSDHPLSNCTAEECSWTIDGVRFFRGARCEAADVLILTEPLECTGSQLTITPQDLAKNGTYALWVQGGRLKTRSVEPLRGHRGWTTH